MLGVYITINGVTIYARTAVNRGAWGRAGRGLMRYETDTGEVVLHRPEDGAVALAKKLLDTIREQRPTEPKEIRHG